MERVDFPAAWAAINGGVNMIKLKHIYKSYSLGDEQVDVLHDINLHVKPKEFVSILGPSGSAKKLGLFFNSLIFFPSLLRTKM